VSGNDQDQRLPGQRYGARQVRTGWTGVCDDCTARGPVWEEMAEAWDDAQRHWNAAHRVTGESLIPSRVRPS